ncbi:outer membrane beta-barrel protein [Alloacidobacterium sp.]|uniref:outer membrane beta-barrel protein n=1 Tax=Alloacidobacterium sp. TaxID=2951999 RepID=UPI002D37915D|nr:outer membrane beta-barrel protein [Alloacidobacterium sp.]HYK36478.1 outer membrane beta-barrel protein [Alloacidobacterium sp.]
MNLLPRLFLLLVIVSSILASTCRLSAQIVFNSESSRAEEIRELRRELASINARLTKLEKEEMADPKAGTAPDENASVLSSASAMLSAKPPEPTPPAQVLTNADRVTPESLNGTTINFVFDGYYGYNFNDPIGRVNLLRAYDVSSNAFSINQADIVLEHAPDPANGKLFGARLDLQFGQATETLQGNPANEPRPEIYRNIFQAYGTYVVPIGSGLTVDFGKWGSALGIEGNYTKDQINYSRSYWFNYLPFYHMGLRATYALTPRISGRYWMVNGTQQTEPFNNFKDEMFGFEAKPIKSLDWTFNYYLGQEHPDFEYVTNGPPGLPEQQGVPFEPISNSPKGKLHIFDSYATWTATPKLTLAIEGDYVISRDQTYSAPQHTDGGAFYARYQFNPLIALGGRMEYLSDRGALFSGKVQALKEFTFTFDQAVATGFLVREELRHDFSNQPYFLTDTLGHLTNDQTTATIGLVWWFGGKQGAW